MHEIITDPREWVLNWLEEHFLVTRQCLENSACLANCTMFEVVDGMLMECDAETDFDCFVPDGTFSECTTVNELVAALERVIENERKKEDENG
jgi:hypothetical protein